MTEPNTDYALRKAGDGYLVIVEERVVGEVYRERQRSDRYPYGDAQYKGRGRWRWMASTVADEEFSTRREAISELLHRATRRPQN